VLYVFKMYLFVNRRLVFLLVCVCLCVPEDGYINRPKHVARFGQWRALSENRVVIDGPSACLLQKYWSELKRVFPGLCVFCFINKSKFGCLIVITTFWNNELHVLCGTFNVQKTQIHF
jgi:hypothetical protein